MSASDESDELNMSSHAGHAVHDLLTDLNLPSHSINHSSQLLSHAQPPIWTFPSASSSRNSPSPALADPLTSPTVFSQRTTLRQSSGSTPEQDPCAPIPLAHQPSLFNTPNRSIFASGPPTSSLSANTAQASMSAPSPANSTRPFSALATPSSSSTRRNVHCQSDSTASTRRNRIPRAEKDVDDPSVTVERTRSIERRANGTPTALTRLFAEASIPTVSRQASYMRTPSGSPYTRASSSETAPLPNHLYNRGLLNGRHSDIVVHAFGTRYALHRLLLDRAPFFSSALSEPWFESSSKEINLHPDDIDSNITQAAFELALKRLYGCNIASEEDKEAIGLFATGCWLEMADLIESSVTSILRQMSPVRLASLIRLVTSNYYGKAGDRILASAKAMLCREGWEMPLRYWDGISGEIAREIIGGDGFFVPGEWERWILAKKVLDRRLKTRAVEAGLFEKNGKHKQAPPDTMNFLAIRFDTVYRKNSAFSGRPVPEAYDSWLALYTSPDIAALLVLLDEGIHYVHLSFEQLQKIRDQRDVLGLPVMPEKVISNALWMSMELRQKVVNAKDLDMELGLSYGSEENPDVDTSDGAIEAKNSNAGTDASSQSKGKQAGSNTQEDGEDDMESGSWDGNGKPRKFWIPYTDSTSVMGGNPDTIAAAANGTRPYMTRHLSRLSASIDPQDVQWASDFTASVNDRPQTPGRSMPSEPATPISYTHYPPFRFAAEFPSHRNLKEKKRVYSRTVWYAGSLWNVYIQKVETTKNTQLGVYLHRAKEKEERSGSVDERIGRVEMLMRRNERTRHHQQIETRADADDDTSGSGGDLDATLVTDPVSAPSSQATALSNLLRGDGIMKASQTPGTLTLSNLPDRTYNGSNIGSEDENEELTDTNKKFKSPTLPPYVDGRPTIKTYFKIYSPSKGGRMLSVYESAPDNFNFSQSWGWKSSTMILDDGLLGYEEGARSKDGRLRFMVVI
ncbi:hypothetical protein MMC29_006881, partial [Sticta canariensis]|nr:hypothetical protein [Sticta canariensis]